MSAEGGNWCLIESDPGVFTELMQGFGAKGVQCEEIFDLDSLSSDVADALGFIFLYKWQTEDQPSGEVVVDSRLQTIFFAKQVITNACATLALVNLLMNVDNPSLKMDETLMGFKSFCASFDSQMKGLTLTNSADIRRIHNSFTCNTLYELDDRFHSKDDDVYHFVSYVPIEGHIYELDGLREGPIDHGTIPDGLSWTEAVRPVIASRMSKAASSYISFNLMAVVPERAALLEKQITDARLAMQSDGDMRTGGVHISELLNRQNNEVTKMRRYRAENNRRRHNYLPFVIETLKSLAAEESLVEMVQKAAEKTKAHKEAAERIKSGSC